MKKNVFILLLGLSLLQVGKLSAQNDRNAFRYSFLSPTGTARYTSLGGSMGAFGADFSTASSNPGALGTYNRCEFTISPSLFFGNSEFMYNGETNRDYKGNFNMGNIGLILTVPNNSGDWKAIQFSTGINRMGNFNYYNFVSGPNNGQASISNYFADLANKNGINAVDGQFTDIASAAYQLFLIDRDTIGNYVSHLNGMDLYQEKSSCTKGSMNEYVFSISGNYLDKIYVGATIGIPYFSYIENSTYTETKTDNSISDFHKLEYGDYLNENGSGVNLKIGMLYQPFTFLRLGFAFHTPTAYNVNEEYDDALTAYGDSLSNNNNFYITGRGTYNYRLTTPYKAMCNMAFIFGNRGFVNIDYEFVDYSIMRLRADDYSFKSENQNIEKLYTSTHSIRIGGELNLSPLYLRAGYAYTSNPFTKIAGKDASKSCYSAGFGIRNANDYIDFAYQFTQYGDTDIFYSGSPFAFSNTIENNHVVLTIGWKF